MSTSQDIANLTAMVVAQEASLALDKVATDVINGAIFGDRIIERLNRARVQVESASEGLRSALGVMADGQVRALSAHVDSVTRLAVIAIGLEVNPTELVLDREKSARQVVFEQFGSLEHLDKFLEINARLASQNFIPAGTVLQLPRG